jgi:hypothetical protein
LFLTYSYIQKYDRFIQNFAFRDSRRIGLAIGRFLPPAAASIGLDKS